MPSLAAAGNTVFDYLALLAVLRAVGDAPLPDRLVPAAAPAGAVAYVLFRRRYGAVRG